MCERVPTLETIVMTALEKHSLEERAAYLDTACGGDTVLRRQVVRLLKAESKVGDFLEKSPLEDLAAEPATDPNQRQEPAQTVDAAASSGSDSCSEVSLDFLRPCDKPGRIGMLGPYEIMEVVGHGGLGIVFKALDPKLNRVVAVKVPLPEYASNATARRRFLREAQAAAAVSHDHVVTIHAVDEADGRPYMVMEFVDGLSLQQRIDRNGPLEVREVLRIGVQIATGLAAAHAQGLIHRDIKPSNILLENGVERVKITDFGLARAVHDVGVTRTGEVAGTPLAMSPEHASGEHVDHRSDLFSLGSVLYVMCAGRPPFWGETVYAVIRRVCDKAPRPLREVNPDIPDWLIAIIDKLLAKKPEDRFHTAAQVADLLGAHLANLQHPMVAPNPASPRPLASQPQIAGGRAAKPPGRRWLWLLTPTVPLLLLAGIIIIIKHMDGTQTRIEVPEGSSVTIREEQGRLTTDRTAPDGEPTGWQPTPAQQAFFDRVAKLSPEEQVEAVRQKLIEVNSGFDGKLTHVIKKSRVVKIQFLTDEVAEIWPVRGLADLKTLNCQTTRGRKGKLADLSPLKGMNLTQLNCSSTSVADLSPLKGMPLSSLFFVYTRVSDLSPLEGMPLQQISFDDRLFHEADLAVLRSLPLKTISGRWNRSDGQGQHDRQPADEFWKQTVARRRAAETFAAETAKLPPEEQVAAVDAKLKELNGKVGTLSPVVENGAVTAVTLGLTGTGDITPLRAFRRLKKLTLRAGPRWLDISAVNNLPLEELTCSKDTAVRNSAVLRGMEALETINGQPAEEYLDSLTTAGTFDVATTKNHPRSRNAARQRSDQPSPVAGSKPNAGNPETDQTPTDNSEPEIEKKDES